jgi:D-beta-D-heptose 7-phosphate kinase/D-beta-D-heptose 1-phosphate adenosyltransferase
MTRLDPQHYLPIVEGMAHTRILCVGDVMLDRFMYGSVDRISPESPIPVFSHERESRMLGGAGNVVRNLLSLGADVTMVSVVGDDAVGNQLTALVGEEARLLPYLICEQHRISSKKTRYVAAGQQLLRADHETKAPISEVSASRLLETVTSELNGHGALILSDYGKGVLTPAVCTSLIAAAKKAHIPVLVDPKHPDISVYAGCDILSPNLRELAQYAGEASLTNTAAIVAAGQLLCRDHGIGHILVTRGKDGMVLISPQGMVAETHARAREVFDVSGAGDTVIATLALTIATGADLQDAMQLSNIAAGIVVGRLGTAVVYRDDITAALYMQQTREHHRKIMPADIAKDVIAGWKRDGLRVGFTNGCFDIMHAGHVSLLQDAKSQCDRLVVGMNTDASVTRLKGPTRPVNAENDRAHLLAAISSVDAVVLFDDDTPLTLLEILRPDILMKGADYSKEQVVGWEMVESYGGRVHLIPLKEGYSTTNMIQKMAKNA